MTAERHYVQHVIVNESPDILFLKWRGDVLADSMAWFFDTMLELGRERKYILVLTDTSACGEFTAAARKYAAENADRLQDITRIVACFGASFQLRILANLVMKARLLLRRAGSSNEHVRFFSTEAEARAWLAEERRTLLGIAS